MENIRKKRSNPLGRYNWLVPSMDTEKFWHIRLEDKSILQYKTVWTSNYGWILISQSEEDDESCRSYQFSIWNPKSSEVINLPPLNLKPKQIIGTGTLLSPPGKPGSMVILFEDYLRYIIYYRFGDKQWTKTWVGKEIADIGHRDARDGICNRSITHCEGKLYAATFRRGYLMLCSVQVSWGGVNHQDITDIDVLKLQLSGDRMEWVRVKSTEDRAFFLSNRYAFSCRVNEPEIEGGHIYLFANKRLYSISIKDKSISNSLPLKNLSKLKNSPLLAMRDLIRLCNPQAKLEHPISKFGVEKEGIVIEDNNGARASNLCDLPFDILEFIAKKLYLVDYINFGLVCHRFRLAAPYIKWSEVSFKLPSPSLSPWLFFLRGDPCATYNFIDPHFGGRYLINIPDGKVRYSRDGWLLMRSSSLMFFYNPFTKKQMDLPQGDGQYDFCVGYSLSSSPTSADSILVGNSYHSIYYIRRRQGEWVEWLEYEIPNYYEPNHNSSIYFDGAFYFLTGKGKVGVFELNDGQSSWKILKELESPCDKYGCNYLSECGGNLLSVFVVDQMVHIYKLNFTDPKSWEKVTSLGNYALFVSSSSSFSVMPNSSNMKNKVYFQKLYGMDIVYYCLSTNKFFTCGNKEAVSDFNNTTEFFFSTWIEPSRKL
ncbi:hypothetical protein PTKIN_Ptkin14bG0045800 [Pterospermum kingtungense]